MRYSPDPASGELLNIGVVLLSPGHSFMGARFLNSWARVAQAFPEADKVQLRRIASALDRSCEQFYTGKRLALQEPSNAIDVAFDAALPRDDAAIVRSSPLTGITSNPERTLNEQFERYVAARDPIEKRIGRDDAGVWRGVSALLKAKNVLERLQPKTVEGPHYQQHFEHAWMNGRWNVAKALSFDLLDPESIATKAASWSGRIRALDTDRTVAFHLVVGMPSTEAASDVQEAAKHAIAILRDQLEADERAEIVPESDAESFAERVARDILDHEAAE